VNTVHDLPMLYELIALALQTDSTRIATLEIGGCFLPQHLGIDKSYHGLSHHGNDEEAIADLITLETYQIEEFGKFLARLAGIEDGGGTLLESTTVLFGSGIGDANSHTNSDLPIVLAGGGYRHGEFKHVESKGLRKVPTSPGAWAWRPIPSARAPVPSRDHGGSDRNRDRELPRVRVDRVSGGGELRAGGGHVPGHVLPGMP
jgi:hypothetical protein